MKIFGIELKFNDNTVWHAGNLNPTTIAIQSSAPTGNTSVLWINSTTSVASYWNGSAWVSIVGVWG